MSSTFDRTQPADLLILCRGTGISESENGVIKSIAITYAQAYSEHIAQGKKRVLELAGPGSEKGNAFSSKIRNKMGWWFGYGISANLAALDRELDTMLAESQREGGKPLPKVITILGNSRGGLEANQVANRIYRKFPQIEIRIGGSDPATGIELIDRLGVSAQDWQDKMTVPASVSTIIAPRCLTENRRTFSGVVPPQRIHIQGKDTVSLAFPIALNHTNIDSEVGEWVHFDRATSEQKQAHHQKIMGNKARRDILGQLYSTLVLGDTENYHLTEEQQKLLREELSENFRVKHASQQRRGFQFYCTTNLDRLSDTGLKESFKFSEMHRAIVAIDILQQDIPLEAIPCRLSKDILKILNTKKMSPLEQAKKIHALCQWEQNNTNLSLCVRQIIEKPFSDLSQNQLMQLGFAQQDVKAGIHAAKNNLSKPLMNFIRETAKRIKALVLELALDVAPKKVFCPVYQPLSANARLVVLARPALSQLLQPSSLKMSPA